MIIPDRITMPDTVEETSPLVQSSNKGSRSSSSSSKGQSVLLLASCSFLIVIGALLLVSTSTSSSNNSPVTSLRTEDLNLEGFSALWVPDIAVERCDYIREIFEEKNANTSDDELRVAYAIQAQDANTFYRATARIFWEDFVTNDWDDGVLKGLNGKLVDGTPLDDKSTWTWVTGDQHLSNFGASRNRHGKVVFRVNDFDEAAIYDFHMDVIRVAVSVCNHAFTNGLTTHQTTKVLRAFTDTYVKTVVGYVGNEDALTFELTTDTAEGVLKEFLKDVDGDKSHRGQLKKYTNMDGNFLRTKDSRLVDVIPQVKEAVHRAFTSQQYGATMMKTGWHVPQWSDEYFAVLDVAARLGSGVGSYGVDRYYVLLNGTSSEHIILDVKFEPEGAVSRVLDDDDTAWYDVLFSNEAARVVEGQRRLTSYTDPFTGWILINGKAFVVRQRSPWKASPNLNKITNPKHFEKFMEMVAIATATSHVRGTQAKSPGQFKEVIASVLGNKSARKKWGKAVARVAEMYREQVLLDYQCFKDYAGAKYPELR
jgi:uncharacterized protein (DUF2252 family)